MLKRNTSYNNTIKLLSVLTQNFKNTIAKYCNTHSDDFSNNFDLLHKEYAKVVNTEVSFESFIDSYSATFICGLFIFKLIYEKENKKSLILNEKDISYLTYILNICCGYHNVLYQFLNDSLIISQIPKKLYSIFITIPQTFNLISLNDIKNTDARDFNALLVYLYQDFLKKYDKLTHKSYGVYYTPTSIVNFIIKSVNSLLENNLHLKGGFQNEKVKVLDFATGTGQFLMSLYDHELQKIANSNNTTIDKDKLAKKIQNDYYGFEIMFTSYVIAHTNLMYKLKKNNLNVNSLPIYLTNTLDLAKKELFEVSHGLKVSQTIKESKDITVIIGNPPYKCNSTNKCKEILNLIKDYKKDLNEKAYNSISDDYVKFIRFAQHKIQQAGYGIVGIVTNNSFLSAPTARKMRKHLLETFDDIYIINLHGNRFMKEPDKNVFDIQVGVCITILVKNQKSTEQLANIYYYSSLDNNLISQQEKFEFLNNNTLDSIKWTKLNYSDPCFVNKDFSKINPVAPFYLFTPQNDKLREEYQKGWSLREVFQESGVGITTAHDNFVIDMDEHKLIDRFRKFKNSVKNINLYQEFNVKEKKGWNLLKAWDKFQDYSDKDINNLIKKINYRPFDDRKIIYEDTVVWRTGRKITQHLLNKDNVGLVFRRNAVINKYDDIFISQLITDLNILGSHRSTIAPLYLYSNHMGQEEKQPNFKPEFAKMVQTKFNNPSPETVLAYIYAVLHSPSYRTKYLELLKIDFPHINFNVSPDKFNRLAIIGQQLIDAHLMKNIPNLAIGEPETEGKENYIVETINYDEKKQRLYFNKTCYFANVTPEIWQFKIGGYQVLDKYLKSRKGMDIYQNLQHIQNIIKVLASTIKNMNEIDKV